MVSETPGQPGRYRRPSRPPKEKWLWAAELICHFQKKNGKNDRFFRKIFEIWHITFPRAIPGPDQGVRVVKLDLHGRSRKKAGVGNRERECDQEEDMLRDPVVLDRRRAAGRGFGEEVIAHQRLHVWIRGVQAIMWLTH